MEKSAGTELQAVLAGERESLNQKLLLLDEKYFRERQDLEQQYSEQSDQQAVKDRRDEYMELFSQKQSEYKNRILNAQLSGGDMGARQEALNIAKAELEVYKQQLEDVDTFESYYRDMGYSDIDIQTLRLQARIKVADAEDAIKKRRRNLFRWESRRCRSLSEHSEALPKLREHPPSLPVCWLLLSRPPQWVWRFQRRFLLNRPYGAP